MNFSNGPRTTKQLKTKRNRAWRN